VAEAPAAVADDRDAIGPCEAAQARNRSGGICACKHGENGSVVHPTRIDAAGPFGKEPNGLLALPARPTGISHLEAAAEEAEQREHEHDDEDDPEDAHFRSFFRFRRPEGLRMG
jgi:hypothetical protein